MAHCGSCNSFREGAYNKKIGNCTEKRCRVYVDEEPCEKYIRWTEYKGDD